ncbi:MAG: PorT family protein [Crocinitomicaceae bacterium]|nr:PorT family protein [Crocinitomicaceae bacterium]
MRQLILVLLCAYSISFGQTVEHWFGTKGGMAFSFAGAKTNDDVLPGSPYAPKGMNAYYFALSYNYLRNNSLVVNADLIYVRKGMYQEQIKTNSGDFLDMKFSADCISIPLKVGVNVGRRIYAQFLFGFNVGLIVNSRFEYDFDQTHYLIKPYKRMPFDFGMDAEARLGYCLKDHLRIFVSVIYDHSFINQNYSMHLPNPVDDFSVSIQQVYATALIGMSFNFKADWNLLKKKKKIDLEEEDEESK